MRGFLTAVAVVAASLFSMLGGIRLAGYLNIQGNSALLMVAIIGMLTFFVALIVATAIGGFRRAEEPVDR